MSSADRVRLAHRLEEARESALGLLASPAVPTDLSLELLGEIDEALWRLDHEPTRFGRCSRCGHPIGRTRLELLPWTRHCRSDAA